MKNFSVLLAFLLLVVLGTYAAEPEKTSPLDNALAKLIEKSIEAAEKTGQFVIDEAPELLQQFYTWHKVDHIIGILFSIFLFLASRYMPYMWLSKEEDDFRYFKKYGEGGAIAAYFIFIIGGFIGIVMLIENIYNLALLLSAPKLYLIEYFLNK